MAPTFTPVSTLTELDGLDEKEIVEGYLSAERGDPEPGANRGKSFWHGWRNRMIDIGVIEGDSASAKLAQAWLDRQREIRKEAANASE